MPNSFTEAILTGYPPGVAQQGHKDRLSAVDASFLAQEKQSSHMHVGALVIFDGPAPAREEFREHLGARLRRVPRYRQKLAFPRLEAGRPFWVDDPNFNLDYHVRHTALPKPGSDEQLRELAGRIFSQRLDRSKPLWEVWAVHGLESGCFAIISKTHHALVDGVAGVDIATVLFDLSPVPDVLEPDDGWRAEPEPSDVDLIAEGVAGLVRTPFSLAGRALGALQRPGHTIGRVREGAEGLAEVVWAGLNPAPDVPLNVEIGPHRRVRWLQSRLADFKEVKNSLGGTVNDAVLAVVAGALRRWLMDRGVRTDGLELRALVPVSIRNEDERGSLGNRIAAMRGPLPVYVDDPVERLRVVREGMGELKESKQALGAEVIAGLTDFAPPTLLAQASRLNFSTRLFNLIVTNVPGPQFPLYLLGREMEEIVPIAFLPENHALAVAIMSYNGKVDFGLLADYDAMPDIDAFATHLEESLAELREAARAAAKVTAKSNGRSKEGTPGNERKKTTTS
jgi:diacylglycerol O-acyltransferase / wax synthase